MNDKLTSHQRAVLERLDLGDQIWTISGRWASAFWLGGITDRSPGFATVHALWKRGYVEDIETQKFASGRKYVITDSGRAALNSGASNG